jgi:hypothetical protein
VWSYRYPGLVMEREKAMELGRFTVLKSDKTLPFGSLKTISCPWVCFPCEFSHMRCLP